jgi:hypothetical protein
VAARFFVSGFIATSVKCGGGAAHLEAQKQVTGHNVTLVRSRVYGKFMARSAAH